MSMIFCALHKKYFWHSAGQVSTLLTRVLIDGKGSAIILIWEVYLIATADKLAAALTLSSAIDDAGI
jgi:hypothetical protein